MAGTANAVPCAFCHGARRKEHRKLVYEQWGGGRTGLKRILRIPGIRTGRFDWICWGKDGGRDSRQ